VIVDKRENWKSYPFGEAWEAAFDFLAALAPDAEEREYPLRGRDLYASVASYETRSGGDPEAHRIYVDVQCLLSGAEAVGWLPARGLRVKTPYSPARDIEFYDVRREEQSRILLRPGLFAVFFPWDAHAPGLTPGDSAGRVKKVVVKIKRELLGL
jgi:YhcH/YjgK/YiaL family protein